MQQTETLETRKIHEKKMTISKFGDGQHMHLKSGTKQKLGKSSLMNSTLEFENSLFFVYSDSKFVIGLH